MTWVENQNRTMKRFNYFVVRFGSSFKNFKQYDFDTLKPNHGRLLLLWFMGSPSYCLKRKLPPYGLPLMIFVLAWGINIYTHTHHVIFTPLVLTNVLSHFSLDTSLFIQSPKTRNPSSSPQQMVWSRCYCQCPPL